MLGWADAAAIDDLADVEAVAQQIGERTAGEGNAADGAPVGQRPHLGDDAAVAQIHQQLVEAAEIEIAAEDQPHPLGLLLHDDELLVLAGIAQRHHAADPQAPLLGGGDLVANALGGDLALELGEGQQHVERQPAHGGGGVEGLGDRDERHLMGIEQLDQLGEVGQRAGQAIDLVDHDDVDPAAAGCRPAAAAAPGARSSRRRSRHRHRPS